MNIAFTFDDGPSVNTLHLLDVLQENGIKATFFVKAQNLELALAPPAIRRMLDEGHEVANHAYDHPNLTDGRNRDAIKENIEKAQSAIKAAAGYEPILFRAPFLKRNDEVDEVMREMGLVYIGGSSPHDWDEKNTTTAQIIERTVDFAKDGCIIVLHDFGNNNTIPAIPHIANELRKKSFGFITVSDLVREKAATLQPGKWYDSF